MPEYKINWAEIWIKLSPLNVNKNPTNPISRVKIIFFNLAIKLILPYYNAGTVGATAGGGGAAGAGAAGCSAGFDSVAGAGGAGATGAGA